MNSEVLILKNIRQTYKADKNPEEQLYSKILKALFRFYSDKKIVQYASRAALETANKMGVDLSKSDWFNQPKFDAGRKIFHFEHCNPISELIDRILKTDEDIEKILDGDIVCWILKSENDVLDGHHYKSKRPGGWKKCYQECGIEPVKIN